MSSSGAPSIGVVAPPDLAVDQFMPFAHRAEQLGFDELWVVEDCFYRGGIAQAAVALARTERIRVGVGILPAGARNPAFACLDLATLANLFPGRLLVGIGHGMPRWMRQTGAWPASPLTLLREYLDAVRSILAGERVTVDGDYVRLRDVRLEGPAPRVVPPVFAGVRGPRSLAVSAELADGTILAEPVTPEYLRAVRVHTDAAGRRHEIVAYNVAAVDDSADRARTLARRGLGAIGDPEWAPHIAPLPFAAEFVALRAAASSREEFAASLPDAWVDQLAVVGTPVAARARLAELSAAGADHLVLIPAGSEPLAGLGSLARVLPPVSSGGSPR
ncbi:MAG TPA: LLM class flavin-dependent oxidoreductase [Pseudonocardia sp.]|nr:LLM class flavin-dependent oxidoreductase [Pseudonocardia sp.]